VVCAAHEDVCVDLGEHFLDGDESLDGLGEGGVLGVEHHQHEPALQLVHLHLAILVGVFFSHCCDVTS